MLKFLVEDTHYRNRFETGTSGGSNYMAARKSWEVRIVTIGITNCEINSTEETEDNDKKWTDLVTSSLFVPQVISYIIDLLVCGLFSHCRPRDILHNKLFCFFSVLIRNTICFFSVLKLFTPIQPLYLTIWKLEFSRISSHGLEWGDKPPKLKR